MAIFLSKRHKTECSLCLTCIKTTTFIVLLQGYGTTCPPHINGQDRKWRFRTRLPCPYRGWVNAYLGRRLCPRYCHTLEYSIVTPVNIVLSRPRPREDKKTGLIGLVACLLCPMGHKKIPGHMDRVKYAAQTVAYRRCNNSSLILIEWCNLHRA